MSNSESPDIKAYLAKEMKRKLEETHPTIDLPQNIGEEEIVEAEIQQVQQSHADQDDSQQLDDYINKTNRSISVIHREETDIQQYDPSDLIKSQQKEQIQQQVKSILADSVMDMITALQIERDNYLRQIEDGDLDYYHEEDQYEEEYIQQDQNQHKVQVLYDPSQLSDKSFQLYEQKMMQLRNEMQQQQEKQQFEMKIKDQEIEKMQLMQKQMSVLLDQQLQLQQLQLTQNSSKQQPPPYQQQQVEYLTKQIDALQFQMQNVASIVQSSISQPHVSQLQMTTQSPTILKGTNDNSINSQQTKNVLQQILSEKLQYELHQDSSQQQQKKRPQKRKFASASQPLMSRREQEAQARKLSQKNAPPPKLPTKKLPPASSNKSPNNEASEVSDARLPRPDEVSEELRLIQQKDRVLAKVQRKQKQSENAEERKKDRPVDQPVSIHDDISDLNEHLVISGQSLAQTTFPEQYAQLQPQASVPIAKSAPKAATKATRASHPPKAKGHKREDEGSRVSGELSPDMMKQRLSESMFALKHKLQQKEGEIAELQQQLSKQRQIQSNERSNSIELRRKIKTIELEKVALEKKGQDILVESQAELKQQQKNTINLHKKLYQELANIDVDYHPKSKKQGKYQTPNSDLKVGEDRPQVDVRKELLANSQVCIVPPPNGGQVEAQNLNHLLISNPPEVLLQSQKLQMKDFDQNQMESKLEDRDSIAQLIENLVHSVQEQFTKIPQDSILDFINGKYDDLVELYRISRRKEPVNTADEIKQAFKDAFLDLFSHQLSQLESVAIIDAEQDNYRIQQALKINQQQPQGVLTKASDSKKEQEKKPVSQDNSLIEQKKLPNILSDTAQRPEVSLEETKLLASSSPKLNFVSQQSDLILSPEKRENMKMNPMMPYLEVQKEVIIPVQLPHKNSDNSDLAKIPVDLTRDQPRYNLYNQQQPENSESSSLSLSSLNYKIQIRNKGEFMGLFQLQINNQQANQLISEILQQIEKISINIPVIITNFRQVDWSNLRKLTPDRNEDTYNFQALLSLSIQVQDSLNTISPDCVLVMSVLYQAYACYYGPNIFQDIYKYASQLLTRGEFKINNSRFEEQKLFLQLLLNGQQYGVSGDSILLHQTFEKLLEKIQAANFSLFDSPLVLILSVVGEVQFSNQSLLLNSLLVGDFVKVVEYLTAIFRKLLNDTMGQPISLLGYQVAIIGVLLVLIIKIQTFVQNDKDQNERIARCFQYIVSNTRNLSRIPGFSSLFNSKDYK